MPLPCVHTIKAKIWCLGSDLYQLSNDGQKHILEHRISEEELQLI